MHFSPHTHLGDVFHAYSPLLTSMKKASLCQCTTPSLQPSQISKENIEDQIPSVLNDLAHHRYSSIQEASTFNPV